MKRFYKQAAVTDDGAYGVAGITYGVAGITYGATGITYGVALDGRPLRTPARRNGMRKARRSSPAPCR